MEVLDNKDIIRVFPRTLSNTQTSLVLKTPKTKTSVRKIFLPSTVAQMLLERKKQIDEMKELFGDEYLDYNLVFCHSSGRPMEGQVINRALKKLILDNDLPDVVFHSFRHASITYKLKWNGGDMKSVQGDSGHARMDMVADVYSHIESPALDTYLNPDAILDGMEVPISGLMNDRYAARTSKDIRRTFDMKRRNGEFIGAFAPYGYAKAPDNKNCLIVDEEAAQVVRNIYHLYVNEGMSISGIVRYLNEFAVLTPTEYKHSKGLMLRMPNQAQNDGMWAVATVRTILLNQMYIGNIVQGKQRVMRDKVRF